ncbi:Pycsar system effector family protein [Bacillus toyonensis]|uniref:Pycsar system effector family protein n=1 Tax=Bacillus toyonensis TaxID=155322 RepID=UPI000BFCEC2C|nr:Pycsar system effector family protein [Bacillus toyonensis]PHC97094.1 hypothetical protein COF44_22775 [Bacillus toyonensis]
MDVEERLLQILDRVNDWLKFAEAKNLGVLAFSGATITAIMSFLGSSFKIHQEWKIGFFVGIGFLSVACLVAVWSFIPKVRWKAGEYGPVSNEDNLFFYGDLCKYKPEILVQNIVEFYYVDQVTNPLGRVHKDIASQIIINSQITMDKFKNFKFAAWLVLAGLVSIIIVPAIIKTYIGG